MKLLAITTKPDAHLPFIQKYLDQEILVFDPYLFPDNNDITYKLSGDNFEIFSQGRNLTECNAVWFRKPIVLLPKDFPVEPLYSDFTHSAYLKTIQGLYGTMRNKVWVSDYWAIQRANNKLLQIELARELGMYVPKTILTSVPKEAAQFLKENKACITKIMGTQHAADDKFTYVFYTTRILPEQDLDLSGLSLAPAIFQEEIVDSLDIRVTVVGNKCFTCEIHKKGDLEKDVDWRKGIMEDAHPLSYLPHELPEELQNICIVMVKRLDLKFGALDFLLDRQGNYWFLEINPNGQWGFIEEETGLPIAKTMVEQFFAK